MQVRDFFRHHPLFAGVLLTPVVLWVRWQYADAKVLLFVLSLLAIVPLAAIISHATEQVAGRIGNAAGGLLTATMGNMTELIIGLAALRAGMFDLVKSALAGSVITNGLFALGLSFLVGGMRHHLQRPNLEFVHVEGAMLLLATIALLIPSVLYILPNADIDHTLQPISLALSLVLLTVYFLGLVFTLLTHPEVFEQREEMPRRKFNGWSLPVSLLALALAILAIVLVSDIFVDAVTYGAEELHLSQAFVGFILVALAGGAAEMYSAVHAASANRPELSVSIALGSSTQISLFVAPVLVLLSYLISPQPMSLNFSPAAVLMVLLSTFGITTIMSSRHTTWYTGVLLLAVYVIFAVTLYLVRLN